MTPSTISALFVALACTAIVAEAFHPHRQASALIVRSSPSPLFSAALGGGQRAKGGDSDDFIPGDDVEYKGETDWDAEWKKVVEQQKSGGGVGSDRPGKDFYKSDAERATIKSVNTVVERVNKAADSMPKVQAPNMRSLQGDWKFWIGILAVVSIGSSLLAASGQNASQFANDPSSYYI